jgi:chemotaxis protein CheZ
MNMGDSAALAPQVAMTASPEVFQQLGLITRQLHDALNRLGVMPKLQEAVDGLPDARSRLSYIATKSGEAADKVLTSVDYAKAEQARIAEDARERVAALAANPLLPDAPQALLEFALRVGEASGRIDGHLTDIMMAQDFHDLTGQVVATVVSLASDLEDSLVKLLVQAAPPEQAYKVEASLLNGPVVTPEGRTDVVSNQGEVDDLLASLGF